MLYCLFLSSIPVVTRYSSPSLLITWPMSVACRFLAASLYNWKRQATLIGHVIRRDGLEHLVTTGILEGKRGRGRQREKILDGLTSWLGAQRVTDILSTKKDREAWRGMIANAMEQGTGWWWWCHYLGTIVTRLLSDFSWTFWTPWLCNCCRFAINFLPTILNLLSKALFSHPTLGRCFNVESPLRPDWRSA